MVDIECSKCSAKATCNMYQDFISRMNAKKALVCVKGVKDGI